MPLCILARTSRPEYTTTPDSNRADGAFGKKSGSVYMGLGFKRVVFLKSNLS
jgi:hypothetical protein